MQDPSLWSEWHVNCWLDWCQVEFGLQSLGTDLRGIQGSELCSLDREGFLALTSDCTAGEILWEHLETMHKGNIEERKREQMKLADLAVIYLYLIFYLMSFCQLL